MIVAVFGKGMTFDKGIESFIREYIKALEDGNAAIFAGSGLSAPSGVVDWKSLLRPLVEEIGLDIDKERDLVTLAQYYVNDQGRGGLERLLTEEFCRDLEPNENHRILSSLPIETYWTTNYDDLIETALKEAGKSVQVKSSVKVLHTYLPRREAEIYKMHGDKNCLSEVVISKYDYESYLAKNELFAIILKSDLFTKTFLFIGFSFEDPNINYILGSIRAIVGEKTRTHYWFVKKPVPGTNSDPRSSTDYIYDSVKHRHRVADLREYSIEAVEVESYGQISEILAEISRRYNASRVFISGSAYSYEPYKEREVDAFVFELSEELIRSGYKIASSFGKGIGNSVINGALAGIHSYKDGSTENNLLLRPSPQNIRYNSQWKKSSSRHRRAMLSEVGFVIFMFGNKRGSTPSTPIEADGVWQEYEIAKELGVKSIALGCMGWVSRKIWEEQLSEFDKYFPQETYPGLRELYKKLGKKNLPLKKCKTLVLKILDTLSGKNSES